jgi:3-oxoacyl-[acyl-carrier-protein] synthase II
MIEPSLEPPASRVPIVALAAVTGLGPDLDTTWRRLLAGDTAVRPITRFDTSRHLAHVASWVEGLDDSGARSRLFPLLEQLLARLGPVAPDTRLITATTKGCIDTLERLRGGLAGNPADVPISGPLGWLSSALGLGGGGVNINVACASSTVAVAHAAALIDAGDAESVLVVCMDLVSEFVFAGFSALLALDPAGCRPFDRNRDGLALGEGAAALLLTSPDRAARERLRPIASVVGWGAANDATHITAPARDGCGLVRAVRQALARAGASTEDIAAINAHGTGTAYNDQMEWVAFEKVFGERRIPLNSIKGAIGHTLGAAGGIEVAIGALALRERVLPPTAGFLEVDPACPACVSARPQPVGGGLLLSTNSGFGGVNAALVLEGEAA